MPARLVTEFLDWEFENIDLDRLLLARSYEGMSTGTEKDLYNYKNALVIMQSKHPDIFADEDTAFIDSILQDLDTATNGTYTEAWAKEAFWQPQSERGRECYEGFLHSFMRAGSIKIGMVAQLEHIPEDIFDRIRVGFLENLSAAQVTAAINKLYPKNDRRIPYQIQPFYEQIVQLIDCYLRFSDNEDYEAWKAGNFESKPELEAMREEFKYDV
ncbi:MAG: hypothetical protein L6R41_002679 [Letrouitia leprolyta]|nr:MAG: hypothetical protein L6R41_002679 [Letrouitia leprolyta]